MHAHRYRITIEGALGRTCRQALEEFAMEPNGGHTAFIADLDQAALHGVLIRIRSLGLELIEIARMPSKVG